VDRENNIHIAYDVYGNFGGEWAHVNRYREFDGTFWSTPEIASIGVNGCPNLPTI